MSSGLIAAGGTLPPENPTTSVPAVSHFARTLIGQISSDSHDTLLSPTILSLRLVLTFLWCDAPPRRVFFCSVAAQVHACTRQGSSEGKCQSCRTHSRANLSQGCLSPIVGGKRLGRHVRVIITDKEGCFRSHPRSPKNRRTGVVWGHFILCAKLSKTNWVWSGLICTEERQQRRGVLKSQLYVCLLRFALNSGLFSGSGGDGPYHRGPDHVRRSNRVQRPSRQQREGQAARDRRRSRVRNPR